MKKIIFFTPSLEKGGSEVVLFNFLLQCASLYEIKVITFHRGSLINLLPKEIEIIILKSSNSFFSKVRNIVTRKLTNQSYIHRRILKTESKFNSDFWFINTIALPDIILLAEEYKKRTFIYIHELVQMIESMNCKEFQSTIHYPERIFCCSQIASQTVKIMGRNNNLHVVYPGVDLKKLQQAEKLEFKHIPDNSFIWGMTGRFDFNKNPIFFIEIAKSIIEKGYNCHFIWFGNQNNSPLYGYCNALVDLYGIGANITFAGDLGSDYISYFKQINGLVLTSQFESFSLITLEALSLKKPVVTYNCGGVIEILGPNYPLVQHYNVNAYCELMQVVMNQHETVKEMIAIGLERSTHFDLSIQVKVLNGLIHG